MTTELPRFLTLSQSEVEYLLSYLDDDNDPDVITLRDKIFHQVYSYE